MFDFGIPEEYRAAVTMVSEMNSVSSREALIQIDALGDRDLERVIEVARRLMAAGSRAEAIAQMAILFRKADKIRRGEKWEGETTTTIEQSIALEEAATAGDVLPAPPPEPPSIEDALRELGMGDGDVVEEDEGEPSDPSPVV